MRLYHIFWIYLVHQLVACNFSAATSNAKGKKLIIILRFSVIISNIFHGLVEAKKPTGVTL